MFVEIKSQCTSTSGGPSEPDVTCIEQARNTMLLFLLSETVCYYEFDYM